MGCSEEGTHQVGILGCSGIFLLYGRYKRDEGVSGYIDEDTYPESILGCSCLGEMGCSEEGMRLVGIRGCRGGLLFKIRFREDGGATGCGEEGMRQVGIRGCRACRGIRGCRRCRGCRGCRGVSRFLEGSRKLSTVEC